MPSPGTTAPYLLMPPPSLELAALCLFNIYGYLIFIWLGDAHPHPLQPEQGALPCAGIGMQLPVGSITLV